MEILWNSFIVERPRKRRLTPAREWSPPIDVSETGREIHVKVKISRKRDKKRLGKT